MVDCQLYVHELSPLSNRNFKHNALNRLHWTQIVVEISTTDDVTRLTPDSQ